MGATPDLVDLQNALQWHSPIIAWDTEPSDEEKRALEIYVAGTHRDLINDPATWTNAYMMRHVSPPQHKAAKEIVARTPPPTEQELQKARAVVGPHLDSLSASAGMDSLNPASFLPILFAMNLAMYVAFPSLLCALVFRGGLLWRIFGITAVTKNGQQAGRWRLCARNLIVWPPLIIFPFALAVLAPLVDEPDVPSVLVVMAYAALVFLAIAYTALVLASNFTNQRGWPDRLAGTWLVIR